MDDSNYLQLAIAEAEKAKTLGEVPVGAVLVLDNQVIARAYNTAISTNDPSAHAEVNVLRQAGAILENYRLCDSTLYVTLEPCAMCFGALVHARIARLVFGTFDNKSGVCGGCIDLVNQPCFYHKIEVVSGVMQNKCAHLLSDFFKQRRKDKITALKLKISGH